MTKTFSIKEIAKLAGVSPATVSRVLNQNGRYSKKTERKIRKIIKEHNFHPNQMARGLRMNKNQIVGIIVPDITNEFFSSLIREIQMGLFSKDFPIAIYNTNESPEIEKKSLIYLRAQNVSGVVYINGRKELEDNFLDNIPTIYVDREPVSDDRKEAVYISSDNEQGGYLATKELLKKGCRKIATITERAGTYVTEQRLQGYLRALNEFGIQSESTLIFTPKTLTFEDSYELVSDVLRRGVKFDGIFCQTDWLASGALTALNDYGIEIPDKVKLVGFDNISISYLCSQPFSTVKQDVKGIGAYIVDSLMKMISGNFKQIEKIKQFPVELVLRQTT